MKELKGIRYWVFIISLMLTTIIVMADLPVYVIVNNLYTDFVDQVGVVNFIISGTAFMVMISSLAAAPIMKAVGKKNTLVISGIVFLVCGVSCAFVNNAMLLAVLRGVCGFTMGCTNVAAVTIITDYYTDEIKRAKVIGIYNTCMPLIGSVLSATAGILAVKGWQNIFHIYWITLPMMILILLTVPKDVKEKESAEEKKEKAPMGLSFWYMIGNYFLLVLGVMMMQMFCSVYIAEHSLGDTAYTGLVSTVIGYGSVLANLLFGFIYAKLGRKLVPLSSILVILGGLLLIFFPGKIMVFVGYFIIRGGYGIAFSTAYVYTPTLCPARGVEMAIGIATAIYSLGSFLSTYAVTGIQSLFHIETFSGVIPIIVGMTAVLLVIELLLPKKFKKAANE